METSIIPPNFRLPTSVLKYLVTIYSIGRTKGNMGYVKNQEIARKLQVRAPSVTSMLSKLDEMGLVSYAKRKGVKLAPAGKQISSEIMNQPNEYIGTILTMFADLLEKELPEHKEEIGKIKTSLLKHNMGQHRCPFLTN